MGKKKATKAKTASGKPPKAAGGKPRAQEAGPRRAAPDADPDDELLAQLLELQERTAAVGRQIRAVSEMVSSVSRQATLTAAELIEQLGAAVDAESPTPPPVAARPRKRRS